jgi:triphosphoribosyl-dephospho-CoA synthetase
VIGVAGNPKPGNVDRTSSADVSDKSNSGDPIQCLVND